MERKPLHWSIGLVPPAWMALQMVIMFSFMDTLYRGDRIWLVLWIIEAVVTLGCVLWWINTKVGIKTSKQKRWLLIVYLWIALCYTGLQVANHFNPSPNYSNIPGTGEAHFQAVRKASDDWGARSLQLNVAYAVVMFIGVLVLAFFGRPKLMTLNEPTSSTSPPP